MSPKLTWDLFDAPYHIPLMIIAFGYIDPQDFWHRIRNVGVPTTGPKTYLAKDFAVME